MDRTLLRQQMRAHRDTLSHIAKAELSARIAVRLLRLVRETDAARILLYADTQNEVSTQGVMTQLLAEQRQVYLPVAYKNGNMHAFRLDATGALRAGLFGVPEPEQRELALPEMFDLAIVPGVAFDRQGGRIGYGKGYYDRYLPACRCKIVGLAYPFQIVDKIELHDGDVRMDLVLTPDETIICEARV